MVFCSNCGKEVKDSEKYCKECGNFIVHENKKQNLDTYCTNCGRKALDNEKFCEECGTKINRPNLKESLTEKEKSESFNNIINNNTAYYSGPIVNDKIFNQNYKSNYRKNNKKKYIFLSLAVVILIFGLILFINRDKIYKNYRGKRTIMIYMIGSNLESDYYTASSDIEEMISSNADFDNINLLLYTGGTKTWHNENIPNDKNAIFKVDANGLTKLEEYEEHNMGDPDNLSFFLEYGYKNYKADNYSVILWNHGGGPIYGYGYDEYHKRDNLTLLELKKALDDSPFNAENKLEFIGFDACLMGSIEVAISVSNYADYLIASEELEPGAGWDYNFLSTIEKSTSTVELGKNIIDYYSNYYGSIAGSKGVTLSLMKLSKSDTVERELNNLFKTMDKNLKLEYSTISRSRSNSKTFGSSSNPSYDLVDLYDLVENLPYKYKEKKETLKSAIEDLIVYQKTDLVNTYGVSIYFPYENKSSINKTLTDYKALNLIEEYTRFIDNFSTTLTGSNLYNWSLEKNIPITKEDGVIEVKVQDEIKENYSSASYIIFEKDKEGNFTPIYRGSDVSINDNVISTTISKKALLASDTDGNSLYVTSLESEKGKNYTKYLIPGTLQRWDNENLDNYENKAVFIELVVDETTPNGRITGAIPLAEKIGDVQVSPKTTIDINDWDYIQLLNFKYKILDSNGSYTSNWQASGEATAIEAEIKKGFTLEFKDLDVAKDYYALFKINDSQGNSYMTNIVKVKF